MTIFELLQSQSSCSDPITRWQASFVLKHGRVFMPRKLPKNMKPGKPFECFANCQRMLSSSNLTYCEGFAIHLGSPVAQHHAWLGTDDGFVVDPTWTGKRDTPGLGAEYFGVPLKTEFVLKQSLRTMTYGALLDDLDLWKGITATDEFLSTLY